MPHYRDARMQHRPGISRGLPEVTICIISERLPDRLRQLPLHSLTAEAEGGNLCCSRTSAMSSSPTQRTPRTKWVKGLPTMPTAAYLVAEGISPTTGPGRERKKRRTSVSEPKCRHMVRAMKYGGGPTQPNLPPPLHQTGTSVDMYETPLLFS